MDEVNKLLNDYIFINNKNFDFYFINCDFVVEFDDNFIANIQSKCFFNTDIVNVNLYLLYFIDCYESRGLFNINQTTINIISDRCNMTYENYINQPMSMCERKINMNIARNPQMTNLWDRNKNHSRIRKYLHIPVNK